MSQGESAHTGREPDPILIPPAPELQSVRSADELARRPSRAPDFEAESRALIALAREMATSPEKILQKLTEAALTLCGAHSAGISILAPDGKRFYWPAIAGRWAEHLGGGTPREFGPCGTVLDRNAALLFSHPERDFDYLSPVTPPAEEALLMPFYAHGKAIGTIWIIAHDDSHHFEAEDLRLMSDLGAFAASAYQTLLALNATENVIAIVKSSDDAIITSELNGVITSWNPGAERIFGYLAEEIIGKSTNVLIPLELQDEEPTILERVRRGEHIDHYETIRVRKDGSSLNISLTVSPLKGALGTIVGASKIARDVTARKEADALIGVLGREAEHRTRNVLTTVQAMIHLTRAETASDLRDAIEGRIQTLANAHALFVESRWVGADIHNLITQELAPYHQDNDARVRIEGPKVLLEPNTAQTIAVTFHELATNAAKYGALSTEGCLKVEWSHSEDGRVVLRWTEAGGPLVSPPTREGFGTRVIENMIKQLRGEMRFEWKPQGLVCEIIIPAA
jgi:PAS domain S-box-containing protein